MQPVSKKSREEEEATDSWEEDLGGGGHEPKSGICFRLICHRTDQRDNFDSSRQGSRSFWNYSLYLSARYLPLRQLLTPTGSFGLDGILTEYLVSQQVAATCPNVRY